jgi:hypothetical protein
MPYVSVRITRDGVTAEHKAQIDDLRGRVSAWLNAQRDLPRVQADIEHAMEKLRGGDAAADEPMFNLLVHFNAGRYLAVFFPRRAHRPARYYDEGPGRLSISPAILEMAGILVTTDSDQFEHIDAATARAVYEEVSLSMRRVEE